MVAMAMLLSVGHLLAQTPDPQPPGYVSDPGRPALNPFPAEQEGKRFEVVVNGTLTTTSGEVVHDWVRAGK
jgi:hypothetical protein